MGAPRGADPGQDWAAWLASWGFPATLARALLLILLFPTGQLSSPRWRVVATLVIVGAVLVAVGNAFTPLMANYPGRHNPLGVEWFTELVGARSDAVALSRG